MNWFDKTKLPCTLCGEDLWLLLGNICLVWLEQLDKTDTMFQNDLNVLHGYSGDRINIVAPSMGENSNLTSYGDAHNDDTASPGSVSLPYFKTYHDIVTQFFKDQKQHINTMVHPTASIC